MKKWSHNSRWELHCVLSSPKKEKKEVLREILKKILGFLVTYKDRGILKCFENVTGDVGERKVSKYWC